MDHRSLPTIIVDTDLDTDCDDAGALAVLHALDRGGECRFVGVVCSAPIEACAPAARAINLAYDRADIPIGRHVVGGYAEGTALPEYRRHRALFVERGITDALYAEALAATVPDDGWQAREAVSLYRELLANMGGEKAVICAIGTHSALSALLASGPDEHSPLTGLELVKRSVEELVTMAKGDQPHGQDTFNWRMDLPAAAAVLEGWPTPVTVSPVGTDVHTGACFVGVAPRDHPVRRAYVAFLGGGGRNRSSWDQIAVLYAVRGTSGPFALGANGGIVLDIVTGRHTWTDAASAVAPRRIVKPTCGDAALATEIERLMIESLNIPNSSA